LVLQAHNWQEEPHTAGGRRIGDNPRSQHLGAQEHSANEVIEVDLRRAGGTFGVAGDYLYHSYQAEQSNGTWGLFRVQPGGVFIAVASVNAVNQLSAAGLANAGTDGQRAASVDLYSVKPGPKGIPFGSDGTIQGGTKITKHPLPVNPNTGTWRLDASPEVTVPEGTFVYAQPASGGTPGTLTTVVVVPRRPE
jgi:hypothetical protein